MSASKLDWKEGGRAHARGLDIRAGSRLYQGGDPTIWPGTPHSPPLKTRTCAKDQDSPYRLPNY